MWLEMLPKNFDAPVAWSRLNPSPSPMWGRTVVKRAELVTETLPTSGTEGYLGMERERHRPVLSESLKLELLSLYSYPGADPSFWIPSIP